MSVPQLDLSKVMPNFSLKQQQAQLKQYQMQQADEPSMTQTMSTSSLVHENPVAATEVLSNACVMPA